MRAAKWLLTTMRNAEAGIRSIQAVRLLAGVKRSFGGNLSAETRRVVYFRLKSNMHITYWRDYVQDALLEFAPVRNAIASPLYS